MGGGQDSSSFCPQFWPRYPTWPRPGADSPASSQRLVSWCGCSLRTHKVEAARPFWDGRCWRLVCCRDTRRRHLGSGCCFIVWHERFCLKKKRKRKWERDLWHETIIELNSKCHRRLWSADGCLNNSTSLKINIDPRFFLDSLEIDSVTDPPPQQICETWTLQFSEERWKKNQQGDS